MSNKLQSFIPEKVQREIIGIAHPEVIQPVYRVAKEGGVSASLLQSTYEEFPNRFPDDFPGKYSTSVYDVMDSCERFIQSLKGRIRKKYPHPIIVKGSTKGGLSAYTREYDKSYRDEHHIDWWIFEGQRENALLNFEEYTANEKSVDN